MKPYIKYVVKQSYGNNYNYVGAYKDYEEALKVYDDLKYIGKKYFKSEEDKNNSLCDIDIKAPEWCNTKYLYEFKVDSKGTKWKELKSSLIIAPVKYGNTDDDNS